MAPPSVTSIEDRLDRLERQNVLLWSALGISLAFVFGFRRRFVGREAIAERFLLVDKAKMFGTKKVRFYGRRWRVGHVGRT